MAERDFSAIDSTLRTAEGSDPQATLLAVLQAISAGRFDLVAAHLTEDSEFHVYGFPAINGSSRGAAAVVATMASNFGRVTNQKSAIEGMIREGDQVALKIRETGELRADGSTYETTGVLWFTFRDGRISRVDEYLEVNSRTDAKDSWYERVKWDGLRWWVPAGYVVSDEERLRRRAHWREYGSSEVAFDAASPYPVPAAPDASAGAVPDWTYDGRVFGLVENTANGDNRPGVRFQYRQQGNRVWATYEGGDVTFGMLVARVEPDGQLDMRYQHWGLGGIRTGQCRSTPEWLADGRLRLHEEWQWTNGDGTAGRGVIEEVG